MLIVLVFASVHRSPNQMSELSVQTDLFLTVSAINSDICSNSREKERRNEVNLYKNKNVENKVKS